MTTAVKRACDACHRRKVKCDGINPCRNCHSAQLSCTYNAIPQKKGPKGSRAKVISELRETQRQTSLATKVHNRLNGALSPPSSPTLSPTPGLLTKEMVKECVEFYFNNMYPTMPILLRQQLEHDAATLETNLDTYCLLTALCAFMMLQPGMAMPGGDPYGLDSMPGAHIVSGTLLMEETIRVRKSFDYLDPPTLNGLCTSYLLFACYYAVDLHDKAWFHLREATTVAHMIGMNKEESYLPFDNATASRRRRLYWLLYVTERAYALQRHRPLTLQATINLPTPGDDPSDPLAHHLSGFVLLVNLFRPFDDQLVNLWNKTKADFSPSYMGALQKQLSEVLPAVLSVGDAQLADARTNQTWLKNVTWQFGLSRGVNSNDPNMQLNMDMSRDLIAMTTAFSSQNMDLLSSGFVEKIFEVSSSLIDVLNLQPVVRNPSNMFNPHESLQQILNIIGMVRSGETRFLPLMLSKMNEVVPCLVNPMLQNVPENACSIDIFDGFGNAGMGQSSMAMDDPYDRKFSVPRIEEFKSEPSTSSCSAPSVADMSSPFVSSPSVLSPGIEFPHGLPSDFGPMSSMSDMVMSPVGGPGQGPGGVVHQQQPQPRPHAPHHQQHPPPHQAHPPQPQQHPQHHQQQHQHPHHHPHHQPQQPTSMPALQTMGINTHFQGNLHAGMPQTPTMALSPQALQPQQIPGGQGGVGQNLAHQQGFNPGMGAPHPMAAAGGPGGMGPNPGVGGGPGGGGPGGPAAMMMRPHPPHPPQRANSFAVVQQQQQQQQPPQPPQPRTVGDFQALQRTTSDMSGMGAPMAMAGMVGAEIDFNTLPR